MKKNFLLFISIVLVVLLGIMFLNGPDLWIERAQKFVPNSLLPKQRIIQLSEQNNSRELGIARIKQLNGKVIVTLELEGAPKDVKQPAHIHVGGCPNPGAVKYPLTSIENGKSETTLNLTIDQLAVQAPLAINVHKSADEANKYVSCGNLPQSF